MAVVPEPPIYIAPPWPVWLWRGGDVALYVDEPPERFALALSANTGSTFLAMLSGKTFAGRVDGGHFVVAGNTAPVQNSWQSFLDATVEPSGSGSLIRGRFRLHRFVLIFSMIWIGFASLGAVGAVTSALFRGESPGAVVSLAFPAFFIVLLSVARVIALRQEPVVVRRIREIGSL